MKVFLLHEDRDFAVKPGLRDAIFDAMASGDLFALTSARRDLQRARSSGPVAAAPGNDDVLTQDLELQTLWNTMAAGDEFLFEMAKRGVLSSLSDTNAVVYRQRVLADCLEQPETVRQLYELAIDALENERKVSPLWNRSTPDSIVHRSVQVLTLQVEILKRLRQIAEQQAGNFRSEGFRRFFAMLREELSDYYLQTVEHHLRELEFKRGLLESAELAKGNKGRRYVVRKQREQSWTERLSFGNRSPGYSFTIPARDENGFRALEEIRGKGLNLVANAVAQSADHVKSFFSMLRIELAFYLGCLNLRERLDAKGEPGLLPHPAPRRPAHARRGGHLRRLPDAPPPDRVVDNEVNADGKSLVMITGANQGGKSTLLRSLGLAHLMMQSGMFVGAQSFRASVCVGVGVGVFTH